MKKNIKVSWQQPQPQNTVQRGEDVKMDKTKRKTSRGEMKIRTEEEYNRHLNRARESD